ncbi:MAG: PD40 domain-containing protein [Ardenticatenaceae bacterium]|nr:PD40 domain-containing protein [Ardenticatenaceae bacterium]MCB9004272.1 PD40 domain-containing protein [Ardenticatenaceae bacterium]
MMKPQNSFCILVLCLLLAACGTAQPAPMPTEIAQVQVTDTPVLPTATATTLLVTNTATPTATIVSPTETATPLPTSTITPVPTTLPTSLPIGHIYFMWDSKPLPQSELSMDEPVQNLYVAKLDLATDEWLIEPVLTELVGWPYIQLSPDKTKFLLTILEDRNNDGQVSVDGYNRGFDGINVYTYTLDDQVFTPITSSFPVIFNPFWRSDNRTIVFGQSTKEISFLNTETGVVEIIRTYPEQTRWIDLSPDSQFIALNFDSIQISFLDLQTKNDITITNEIGGIGVDRAWSSDGAWLFLGQPFTNRYMLVDVSTFETYTLSPANSILNPVWSPNNQQMSFVQEVSDGTQLMLLDPISLTTQQLLNTSGRIHYTLWSPNGQYIAVVIADDEKFSLVVFDVITGMGHELWQSSDSKRFYIPSWSPDNQWLLFFDGQGWSPGKGDHAGLYAIHRDGGVAKLILDTSGTYDPYGFYWLPETETR